MYLLYLDAFRFHNLTVRIPRRFDIVWLAPVWPGVQAMGPGPEQTSVLDNAVNRCDLSISDICHGSTPQSTAEVYLDIWNPTACSSLSFFHSQSLRGTFWHFCVPRQRVFAHQCPHWSRIDGWARLSLRLGFVGTQPSAMAPWCQNGLWRQKTVHLFISMKGNVHKCRNLCYDFKKDYEIVLKVFHCVVLYSGNRILKSSFTSVL